MLHEEMPRYLKEGRLEGFEIVRLGEEFELFKPSRTFEEPYHFDTFKDSGLLEYKSEVTLATDIIDDFPINIEARLGQTFHTRAFTPFAPRLGYTVTKEDFDPNSRIVKVSNSEWVSGDAIFEHAPLKLRVVDRTALDEYLSIPWSFYAERPVSKQRQEYLDVVERLRLSVIANGMRFEGKPEATPFKMGFLVFDGFYPVDTGPLAVPTPYWRNCYSYPEALSLFLPYNTEILASIKGRFILLSQGGKQKMVESEL